MDEGRGEVLVNVVAMCMIMNYVDITFPHVLVGVPVTVSHLLLAEFECPRFFLLRLNDLLCLLKEIRCGWRALVSSRALQG